VKRAVLRGVLGLLLAAAGAGSVREAERVSAAMGGAGP
jgi:hypothetical protein